MENSEQDKTPNSKCIICNKEYYVCSNCQKLTSASSWRSIADNITCYKIFMILEQYASNDISKEEAKELLSNIDLSELDTYANWVQFQIKNIMK